MSIRGGCCVREAKLRKILLIATLGAGSLMGIQMPPDKIEEFPCQMNKPEAEIVIQEKKMSLCLDFRPQAVPQALRPRRLLDST